MEELFSTEELALLDASSIRNEYFCSEHCNLSSTVEDFKRRRKIRHDFVPGTSVLLLGALPPESPPKRQKFGSQRREEVGAVRKQGACLRCILLKLGVMSTLSNELECLTQSSPSARSSVHVKTA